MNVTRIFAICSLSLSLLLPVAGEPAAGSSAHGVVVAYADDPNASAHPRWRWPLSVDATVVAPYRAPAHDYGSGHRGVDIAAAVDSELHAPAPGVIAFRGVVVDRPLLTIEHADGYVTTFEPAQSVLKVGDAVAAGDLVGTVSAGGHALAGTVHLGVRLHGAYIDPMLLFGQPARAILLPCCEPL